MSDPIFGQRQNKSSQTLKAASDPAEEARLHPRSKTYLGGKIVFNSGNCLFDCLVRDLAEGGARLQVELAVSVTDEFQLVLSDGRSFSCRVKWQKPGIVGVQFVRQ